MPLAAGIGLALTHSSPPPASGARIVLSNATIAENAAIGEIIGTLAVAGGTGSHAFAITADPDEKFALDGNALELDALLDHATAATHAVTIEADNGIDVPLSRAFTIAVIAVGGLVSISLTPITEGRTFQRTVNSDGSFETSGPVALTGSTDGQATAIEARLLLDADDSVVVDWTVIDPAPAADGFAGTLTVPQGGPYYLEVRDASETTIGDQGSTTFKLGLLAIGLSQSNMAGMFSAFSTPATHPDADPLTGWFNHNDVEWQPAPGADGVRELMNRFVALTGVPIALGNPAVGAAPVANFLTGENGWEGLNEPGEPGYQPGVERLVGWMGGDIEVVLFRGGEAEANGTVASPLEKKNTLKADLVAVRDQIETLVGHPVTVICESLMTTTVVGGTTDDAWAAIDAGIYELCQAEDRFILCASVKDAIRVDDYHPDAASHGEAGKRFGQSLAVYAGHAGAHPAWHIVSAEIIDATSTRVTLAHAMGTDFTPSDGITDFEITGNNGATWLACTGERLDATHIRLVHDTLATANARSIRHQYGMHLTVAPGDETLKNPVLAGMVRDNSPLAVPLYPSAGRSITAPGFADDPTPTWIQQLSGAFGGGGGGIDQHWSGINLSAAENIAALIARIDGGTFSTVTSMTITPDGGTGTPITASLEYVSDTGIIAIFTIPPGTSGLANCDFDLSYDANPFGGTWVNLWSIPADVDLVATVNAAAETADLETAAGGFILAAHTVLPTTESGGGHVATWGGDTPDVASRANYDNGFFALLAAADVAGTATAPDTTITATFGLPGTTYALVAASFR